MARNPFLIFMAVVGLLVSAVVWFIQSPQFASVVKRVAARYVPKEWGITADFTELAVKLFPPGISIRQPRIMIHKSKVIELPAGSSLAAERLDLNFLPFQMFSGNIWVHEAVVVNGDLQLSVDPSDFSKKPARKKGGALAFNWDELVKIKAESIALENTRVRIAVAKPSVRAELVAKTLRVGQWKGRGGMGYRLEADLEALTGQFPQDWGLPSRIEKVRARGRVNAAGVQLDEFAAMLSGIEFEGKGSIAGNVMQSKGLKAEGSLGLKARLARVLELVPKGPGASALPEAGGIVSFRGKVQAGLDRVLETLRAEGAVSGEKLRFGAWEADELVAEGSWEPKGSGLGEVRVAKAMISANDRARSGGFQAGRGGRVEVGAFRFSPGSGEPISVPLKLERAHLHWLGAGALEQVYPLDLRASGAVQVDFSPGGKNKRWTLGAKFGLKVEDFRLDNQRLGKTKALKTILAVPKIQVSGGVSVDPRALKLDGIRIQLQHTSFAGEGKVDFKEGFDLRFDGETDLADVGTIAENAIRGQGRLVTRVHGTTSKPVLDFDAEIDDAYYLNMHLGDIAGRITWDDAPEHLNFTDLRASKGRSVFVANGRILPGKEEKIALTVPIQRGSAQDFIQIFREFVTDISWFPRSLVGNFSGKVEISGGLSLDRLQIAAHLSGADWEYWDERFRRVEMRAGYDRGRYYVDSFRGFKPAGSVTGRVSFGSDRKLSWEVRGDGLNLTDLDHVARLDVPMRGNLGIRSSGEGALGSIKSESVFSLTDFRVRGQLLAPSELDIQSENGTLKGQGSAFGGQGELQFGYDFRDRGPSYLKARFEKLDFSPALLLLNPKAIQDRQLTGSISGAADLSFRSGEIERASGKLELSEYLLAKTGARFELMRPVSTRVDRGSFDLERVSIHGQGGEATLSLKGRESEIQGSIHGRLELSILEFFTSSVAKASGAAALDFDIGGELKAPTFYGKATLDGASLQVSSVESPIENITGSLQLRQNVLTAQSLEADLAGGRVSASGTVELFPDRYPKLALAAILGDCKLKVYPFQYVKVRGKVAVRGEEVPYLVSGSVRVDSALSKEKVLNAAQGRALKAANYTPPPAFQREGDAARFKLAIDVEGDRNILVQNDLFDAELKAKVKVVNTIDTPRIVGLVDTVQGKILFRDRPFVIQSASMNFDNPNTINPKFNLISTADVNGTKIQLVASGRLDKYKIELSSTPVLPETEIIQLLALGVTSDDLRKLRAGERTALQQGEAASLLLQSLDFNRELQDKTGIQFHLDEAVNTQSATSIFRGRQDTQDNAAAPKIVLKRRVVDKKLKVDLSVGSTIGYGTNNQKEVNAEVQFTPGVSVIGVWDSLEGVEARDVRESYGVDLKVQKRF